jgi:hypothetical protein
VPYPALLAGRERHRVRVTRAALPGVASRPLKAAQRHPYPAFRSLLMAARYSL